MCSLSHWKPALWGGLLLLASAWGGCAPGRPPTALRVEPSSGETWPSAPTSIPQTQTPFRAHSLRASGRFFLDEQGRVVILRGVNLAGDSKVPPFVPLDDPSALDRLTALGMNVVRLLFVWEAFEPTRGNYDEAYLARMVAIARAAGERGLYVVLDIHQDGFARWVAQGCGAGFPRWAISPRARCHEPVSGAAGRNWVFFMMSDPGFHRSFADFYADTHGVRTAYLRMLDRVAAAFATVPGVIGYDPINEPWGDGPRQIVPLYRDAAQVLRARHPDAILFLEGHGVTCGGIPCRWPRPAIANIAYAPHYYEAKTVVRDGWRGSTRDIDRAFATLEAKAEEWNAPLFLGEFGLQAGARRAGDYVSYLYDHLDASLASGAQWNYTPHWNDRDKDGWNGEDYNILDPAGAPRPNFRVRPYPQKIAGLPLQFIYRAADADGSGPRLTLIWEHHPDRGATEVFLPRGLLPVGSRLAIEPTDASYRYDEQRQILIISIRRVVQARVNLGRPPIARIKPSSRPGAKARVVTWGVPHPSMGRIPRATGMVGDPRHRSGPALREEP